MTHETYRKLIHYGARVRVITIPEPWLRFVQRKEGKILERVRVVSHEDRLEIFPDFERGEPDFPKDTTKKSSKLLEMDEDEAEEKE